MNAQQLRNSILQEAIEGRLVPQDPNDEPASVLLEGIREEKKRLFKEGKLKKKDLEETPISEDEKPFDIPDSWEWCKLGWITTVLGGKRIPAGRKLSQENTGHIYIRVSDMKEETVSTENLLYVPNDIFPSISRYIIKKENVYITVAGTIGKIGKIPFELDGANLTENADRLVFSYLNQDWLIKFLQSPEVQSQINDVTTKVGQPKLAIQRIQNLILPLPPLAEQKRIVAKIEEMLPKVAEYGKAQDALNKLNEELPEKLKKSVLQEAISGRLVSQDPNDEPASTLLNRIRAEKKRLFKEGKLKKKDLEETPISEDEKPFDIPDSWEWCKFGNVISLLSGRDLTPQEYSDNEEGLPYITGASNFDGDSLIINRWTSNPVTISKCGDLLITCKGTIGTMSFNKIGDIHIARQVMAISPYIVDIRYIRYFLMRIVYELEKKAKSIIPGISREDIINATFPLPPLAEQKRIVAKIEEVFKEIDKLKK